MNDNVFGQAEIGAEFGIDPALFERVEIIRGPASSLYGNSAFFAVVNVITKSGASLDGASLTVEDGTLGTRLARASAGRRLASGLDVAVAGTYQQSAGVNQLYFPAFDAPGTNNGIAQGLDGQRVGQIYGQLRFKDLVFTGVYGTTGEGCADGVIRHLVQRTAARVSRRPIAIRWPMWSTHERSAPAT